MAPQVTDGPRRLLPSLRSTMIPYLLFSALIIGAIESQTANMTEEEFRNVEGNQTFSVSNKNNSEIKPENVTSSWDKYKSHVEDELQNQTVITEDDESFQEQEEEFPGRHCNEIALIEFSRSICKADFDKQMLTISPEDWCVLENIIRPYNNMTICLERLSSIVNCYYPNSNIQDFFREIHLYYFHNCSTEEQPFMDAPHGLVVVLTLIPVSLIPVLVYMVVWKSKVQD
ncbi:hypothetical protein PAMP_009941 [Pampus punctatissimus]